MKKRIELRRRRSIIHTSTVHREWHREEELEISIVTEPEHPPYPADSAGIDPRRLRRPEFPRPCGVPSLHLEEDADV